jgi:hypothetical protein
MIFRTAPLMFPLVATSLVEDQARQISSTIEFEPLIMSCFACMIGDVDP